MKKTTMKLRLIFFVSLFLFCQIAAEAQSVKFGKVSKDDLSMKSCLYDEEADAEYLFHSSIVSFEYNSATDRFELIYNVHERLKIYNQNGRDQANFSLPYYVGSAQVNNEDIYQVKGITYNLVNGKIKESKLEKKNIYEEKKSDSYNVKKFALPAVKAGSIIDVKYKLRSPRTFAINEFYFQKSIPVRKAFYESYIPEYYDYTPAIKGLLDLKKSSATQRGSFSYQAKTSSLAKVTQRETSGFERQREKRGSLKSSSQVEYKVNVTTYEAENVISVKDEPYVYTMDNYRSSIIQELTRTKFFGNPRTDYTTSWNQIAIELNNNEYFGGALKRKFSVMKPILAEVKDLSDKEKVAKIYGHFQENYRWNGLYSIYAGKGLKECLKTGVGTTGQINLLLVNTLRKAGVEAYPLVYKAGETGNLNAGNPTLNDLNYVIALIQFEDGVMYLDGTSTAVSPGMLPIRALNLIGVVMDKDKGLEMRITNPNKGDATNYYTLKVVDNTLTGTFQKRIKGYSAYSIRVSNEKEEVYLESLSNDVQIVENAEVKDFYNNKNSLAVSGSVTFSSGSQNLGDKIIIDINLLTPNFENPFTSPSRNAAIFYASTLKENNIIKIAIPEGYKVESLPEKLSIASPEKQLQYLVELKVQGNEVILNIRETRNISIVNPEYYESVKAFYEQVQAKFQEKIVFVKA